MDIIKAIEQESLRKDVPQFKVGDTVRVYFKVIEGNKERIQAYEGVVTARKGSGISETFTVRKNSYGVGVDRVFPLHSPKIASIEVIRTGKVRQAKLYFLKDKVGQYRIKEKGQK